MTLIRWSPSTDLLSTWNQFDRLFNRLYEEENTREGQAEHTTWSPVLDLTERKDRYVLKMELPGLSADDVEIRMQKNVLTIRGEKPDSEEPAEGSRYYRERRFGKFERSLYLNDDVDKEHIEADYSKGIMTLTLPKSKHSVPREIPIKFRK